MSEANGRDGPTGEQSWSVTVGQACPARLGVLVDAIAVRAVDGVCQVPLLDLTVAVGREAGRGWQETRADVLWLADAGWLSVAARQGESWALRLVLPKVAAA